MTDQMTIDRLENALRSAEADQLDDARLTAIRSDGTRRRRIRRTVTGLAAAVAVGALATTIAVVPNIVGNGGAGDQGGEVATADRPDELSPLQQRVLREIPGAQQVSDWQVVLPAPSQRLQGETPMRGQFEVEGATLPMDAPTYAGVTAYPPAAFPRWLYDEVYRIETEELVNDDGSYPVGSMTMGIKVESGSAELACVSFEGGECAPAVVRRSGGELFYEWGFGTDEFLKPGTGMEVFAGIGQEATDAPAIAVAGMPGTEVARVEFVNTLGEVTDGAVTHSLVDGASIMWANVPGAVQRVIAYDADGEVVDDHELRKCSGGSDCEVR